ncbi:hypothetical protein ACS0TY_022897 [Phlomoides rotata]
MNVPASRAGAGGKIVTNRRRQRLSATPYDRPPPPSPSIRSPNWFTGVLIPSARAIASGAGKILSSAIFSDSESSSSEDLESVSEDDIDSVNEHESPIDQVNAFNEEKLTSSRMVQHGRESQFTAQRTETKLLIECLIMKENFSREECDRLTKVLSSRVMDWSTEAGEKMSLADSPVQTVDHVDANVSSKAVMEAKKWFREKKGGSSSVVELAHGNCNPNSTVFDHIEAEVGSPVDVARSYMRNKPPWASPKEHVELRTPLTTTMKLFKEGTPYSVNHDILSSSKRRNSHASGSWNIQEELRKVRSKAIDDMLRTPPTREQGAGKVGIGAGERVSELHSFWKTKPIDALRDVGVSSDPALVVLALSALESRQDGKVSDVPSSKPDASVSGNNEDIEAIRIDGDCAPSKFPYPAGPNHAVELHSDPHSTKINGPSAEFGGRLHLNGFSTSRASLSPGEATLQKNEEYHDNHTVSENRRTNTIDDEGNDEHLSEAYIEVPNANETNSIESDSQISLDVQFEESPMEIIQPSTEEKPEAVMGKQRGRKPPGKSSRRGRGRGK